MRRWSVIALLVMASGGGGALAWANVHSPQVSTGTSSAAAPGHASGTAVSVYPIAGAKYAAPRTGITFRGLPIGDLGTISVRGNRSGAHTGRLLSDSDGRGGSFLPAHPFTPGETVTVRTALNIVGGSAGRFQFHIATPAGPIRAIPVAAVRRRKGDVLSFHSRPDLHPAAFAIDRHSSAIAPGDIFLAPQLGPVQDGPMIIDSAGNLVWFKPAPRGMEASDVRVQALNGRSVVTWWQGIFGPGIGAGEDVILDASYRTVAVVHAGNGLSADLHEFDITPQNRGLLIAYFPVLVDARSVHGSRREVVLDCAVQEIDIPTGLVLFQWDSLDGVSLKESVLPPPPKGAKFPYDPVHVNSADEDSDGNLIVSGRNTSAAYKVNRATGHIVWRLGGKRSSFKLLGGLSFAFQHDIRVRSSDDSQITLFDDGAGPPNIHRESRGLRLAIDFKHMTARAVARFTRRPSLLAQYEGNLQQLPNGDSLVGWGQQPYFSEFNPRGRLISEGHFVGANTSYRFYRFPWTATPALTLPGIAAKASGKSMTVWASWNGASTVTKWRVLTGSSGSALTTAATVPWRGFETAITVPRASMVQLEALNAAGSLISPSKTISVK